MADKQKGYIGPVGWAAIAVAIVPFFLKRAILLGNHDYIFWLTADYGARTISLIGVVMARRYGLFASVRPPAGILTSVVAFTGLLLAALYLQIVFYPLLHAHVNYLELSRFPPIPNQLVRTIDLTFGLLLVAVSEESVFRALLITLFERWNMRPLSVVFLSSAAFALIHLTSGTADTINAFLHGLLLGAAYWWTRRLVVCVSSHYLFDLYVFGQ